MLANPKTFRSMKCGMIFLWLVLLSYGNAFSMDEGAPSGELVVGVMASPPAYIKMPDNQWEGLSVEIWQAVAQGMGIPFKYREFSSLEAMFDALEKEEIDVIPAVSVQDRLVPVMDFSQSYLKSGLSIAVPAQSAQYHWFKVIENLFSPHILKAIGLLFFMSLIFGIIVWLFERRRNSEMFGEGNVKGIGHGIWWAMVTMTTVGYGDKAPQTLGGRIFALIWMIFSVVFIASFTATVTSELTIGELRGKVRGFNDLYDARVGSTPGSEAFDYLAKKGIAVIPFENIEKGMSAVENQKIDAFVQDEKILSYLSKREFPGRVQIVGGTFDEYFVSIAVQRNSPLRKRINTALLKIMKTESWDEILNRYISVQNES